MSEGEIRAAVEAARHRLPRLAADFADKAIAASKSVADVKAELVDRMLGIHKPDVAEAARALTVAKLGERYGPQASADAGSNFGRARGVDPKAATVGNPGVPAGTAPVLTMGQRSMLDMVERTQGRDARAKAEARIAARVR